MEQIVEMAAGLTPGWIPDGSVHDEKGDMGDCHVACGDWHPNLCLQLASNQSPICTSKAPYTVEQWKYMTRRS